MPPSCRLTTVCDDAPQSVTPTLAKKITIAPYVMKERSVVANCCRAPARRISLRMQIVMWFAGMRGSVSFALAMTLEQGLQQGDKHQAWTTPIVTTTLALCVASKNTQGEALVEGS